MKTITKVIIALILATSMLLAVNLFRGGNLCFGDPSIPSHCLKSE